jgi:hypothetical protein
MTPAPYSPEIGDVFRVRTAALATGGVITRILRVNFAYETPYMTGEILKLRARRVILVDAYVLRAGNRVHCPERNLI